MKKLKGLAEKALKLKAAIVEQAKQAKKDFTSLNDIIESDVRPDEQAFVSSISDICEFAQTVLAEKISPEDSPAVFKYLKDSVEEILIEKHKYSADVEKKADTTLAVIKDVLEASPEGSFEETRDRVREALRTSSVFPKEKAKNGCCADEPWIRYMFSNKTIVQYKNKYYEVPFTDSGTVIKFGKPVEVVETFKLKEYGIDVDAETVEITESGVDGDFEVTNYLSLKESKYDPVTGRLDVILIEAGTNFGKRRHYPVSTIREAAPIFAGLKMYMNHPTKKEDKERPERSVTDWVSTITESKAEGGKAIGHVDIHDKDLKERMANKTFRDHIGLSINMGGKVSYGKVGGQTMQIVEKIFSKRQNGPASVDWVTEAGARGRVKPLSESIGKEDNDMDIKLLTLKEVQELRPDLLEAYVKSLKEGKILEATQTELKEANKVIADFKKSQAITKQNESVTAMLKESKLHEAAKDRITNSIKEADVVYETEVQLKEAVTGMIKTELEYVNKISGKGKIKTGSSNDGNQGSLLEGMQKDLEKNMGLEEPKKEDD